MVLFNHATREMTAKIVYYGPGLCGKTTNLMVIFDKLDPKSKGKMLSLATKTDRTLFFDLLPVDIGKVGNFNLKIQLYTVPGQVFYNETRKLVLKGADAVVFVADSQGSMVESTRESFENLMENLEQNQLDPNDTPIVIQFNKRDIPGVLSIEELQERLGFEGYPYTEASAIKGDGVMETFKLVSKITAKHLFNRLKGKSESTAPKKAVPAPVKETPKPKKVEPAPEPPPAAAPMNPFADSVPFPESNPLSVGYEKMEEVSLEQLLQEGRERPATFAGDIAIPIEEDVEEVEDLVDDELVPMTDEPLDEEPPIEFTPPEPEEPVVETPEPVVEMEAPGSSEALLEAEARGQQLEQQLQLVQEELAEMKEKYRSAIQEILHDVESLAITVRSFLD